MALTDAWSIDSDSSSVATMTDLDLYSDSSTYSSYGPSDLGKCILLCKNRLIYQNRCIHVQMWSRTMCYYE